MATVTPKILLAELQKVFGPATQNLTEETIKNCFEIGEQLSKGKMRIKDVLQIPDKHMEMLYAIAYNFYQGKKIEKANKIFTMLCTYDPLTTKYWEGFAATFRVQKKYNEAIAAYHMLTQLDALKISYYIDLAECFIKIDKPETAKQCCEAVIFMAGNETFKAENPDAAVCLQKAQSLKKMLNK